MKVEDALQYVADCARKEGVETFDILAYESESRSLELYESKPKTTEISASFGMGIRLFHNGRPGYSYSERIGEEPLKQTVLDALSLSELADPVDIQLPGKQEVDDLDLQLWSDDLQSLDSDTLMAFSRSLEATANQTDPRIEQVLTSSAGYSESRSFLLNSNGVYIEKRRNACSAGVSLLAEKNGVKKSGGFYRKGLDFSAFDENEIAQRATKLAVDLLEAAPIPHGTYPVVFDNRIAPGIVASLVPAFYADSAQKGLSKFKDRVGERVASEAFSLRSDPLMPGMPGSRLYDSEGVPAQVVEVLKKGTLLNFLYNLESAAKEGRASNGSGRRSVGGRASTGFANMIVPLGSRSLDEILKGLPQCLVVTSLEGSGIRSSVSGEISVGVQGFFYKDGVLAQPVDRVTVSGNYFEILPKIVEFSNEYSDSYSAYKVSDMLIEGMAVSG